MTDLATRARAVFEAALNDHSPDESHESQNPTFPEAATARLTESASIWCATRNTPSLRPIL